MASRRRLRLGRTQDARGTSPIRSAHDASVNSHGSRATGYDLIDRGPDEPSVVELLGWLSGSARFRAFAEAHQDKSKKLRTATDAEALRDVRAELRVAQLILGDPRFDLSFEAYGSGKRGPDFTVAFRGRARSTWR